MTKMDKQAQDLEALERLLDIYGADRTRWPARERLRFASVISEDGAAAHMVAEAASLDRLLDAAPRASAADVEALKERIVAAALRSGPPQVGMVAASGQQSARRPRIGFGAGEWPAAALLAASLVLGVMLGSAGTFDTTMREVAQAAGLSTGETSDASQVAFLDYFDGQADEDLL